MPIFCILERVKTQKCCYPVTVMILQANSGNSMMLPAVTLLPEVRQYTHSAMYWTQVLGPFLSLAVVM